MVGGSVVVVGGSCGRRLGGRRHGRGDGGHSGRWWLSANRARRAVDKHLVAYSQRNRPIRCRGQEPPRVTGGGDSFDRAGTAEPDRDADRRAIPDPPPSLGCTVDSGACRLERLQAAGRVGAVRRLGAGDHLAAHDEARRTRGEVPHRSAARRPGQRVTRGLQRGDHGLIAGLNCPSRDVATQTASLDDGGELRSRILGLAHRTGLVDTCHGRSGEHQAGRVGPVFGGRQQPGRSRGGREGDRGAAPGHESHLDRDLVGAHHLPCPPPREPLLGGARRHQRRRTQVGKIYVDRFAGSEPHGCDRPRRSGHDHGRAWRRGTDRPRRSPSSRSGAPAVWPRWRRRQVPAPPTTRPLDAASNPPHDPHWHDA